MKLARALLVMLIAFGLPMSAMASVGAARHCDRGAAQPAAAESLHHAHQMVHDGMDMSAGMMHAQKPANLSAHDQAGCTCGCACTGSCPTVCAGALVAGMAHGMDFDMPSSGALASFVQPFVADSAAALPLRPPRIS